MAERFFEVKLGDFYLTSDGTEEGLPCKVLTNNFEDLQFEKVGNFQTSASRKPHFNLVDNSAKSGIELRFTVETMSADNYADLLTAFNNLLENPFEINGAMRFLSCQLVGDGDSFSFKAFPHPKSSMRYGEFLMGYKLNVEILVITV